MLTRRRFFLGIGTILILPSEARAEKPVILILTDSSARTSAIVDAFKAATEGTTRISYVLTSESDAAAFLADNIRDLSVSAVFAVGDVAFWGAVREFATTPVIYVDVADPTAATGRSSIYGVPSRVDPNSSIAALKGLLPRMTSIGMVRSARDGDESWWKLMEDAGKGNNVKVVVQRVNGSGDLNTAFNVLFSQNQAVLLLADTSIWTGATLGQVLHTGQLAKVPVVGFERSQLTAANPAPLIMETSAGGVGVSAGARCMSVLGLAPAGASVVYPSPWLVGSKASCRSINLLLTKDTAAKVNEWVD